MEMARMEELLRGMLKNRIRIEFVPGEASGWSRFGGKPLLPAGFRWPWFRGKDWNQEEFHRPLTFLMQLDLREIAPLDQEGLLPKSGLLSFFYEVESQPWGFDPTDAGAARVYWFPEETELVETDFPAKLPDYCRMPLMGITITAEGSLPSWDGLELHDADGAVRALLPEDGWDEYDEARGELISIEMDWTQLLGYPDVVQNPMEGQCERIRRGIYCGGPVELPREELAEIEAASGDWILLLQVGPISDGAEFMLEFGDSGYLYFWIRKQDLAEKRFDRVWAIVQCC